MGELSSDSPSEHSSGNQNNHVSRLSVMKLPCNWLLKIFEHEKKWCEGKARLE